MSKTRGARGARGLRSKYRRRPRQLGWAATWKLRRGPCRGPAGRSATVCASAHDARGVTVGWHTKAARHARDGGNAAQEERRAGRGRGRPGRRNERGEGGRGEGTRRALAAAPTCRRCRHAARRLHSGCACAACTKHRPCALRVHNLESAIVYPSTTAHKNDLCCVQKQRFPKETMHSG